MAQIKQVGVGQRSTGTVDGVNYAVINGRTIARRLPVMPAHMFQTPGAKKRQALFTLMQWHLKQHRRTLGQTFGKSRYGTSSNRYLSVNYAPLAQALDALADQLVSGGQVARQEVEQAIAAYATQHPNAILIGLRDGYAEVCLEGAWPSTITLKALGGDNTIVVYTGEDGTPVTPTEGDHAAEPSGGEVSGGDGTTPGGGTGDGTTPGDESGL